MKFEDLKRFRRNMCNFYLFLGFGAAFCFEMGTADNSKFETIFLRLYTGNDSYIDEKLSNASLLVPEMIISLPTVLYVHGYTESVDSESVKTVVDAYLTKKDHNVLAVDYRDVADQGYLESAGDSMKVGTAVARALESMVKAGLDPEGLHIVGHSLGGQVSGSIGRNLTFQVPRITGLDPAGPLYNVLLPHLTAADARFVDVIHTDFGFYGTARIVGTVDFFPNCGHRVQPGCPRSSLPLSNNDFCSHHRSWEFYAESVLDEQAFVSVKCNSNRQFDFGQCNQDDLVLMGSGVSLTATGTYYLWTASSSPFGLEQKGTVLSEYSVFC